MAFLDNSGDIILDAVLTDTGRMRLAKGDGSFKITKFVLADDEINYGLYDKNNASGSSYYDLDILQTPVFEAFTNNASVVKHPLLSLAVTNHLYLPVMKINKDGVTATLEGASNLNALVPSGSTGLFVFDVNGTFASGSTNNVYNAKTPSNNAGAIRIDQGIDNTAVPSNYGDVATIDSSLKETQYMVEVDNRLITLCDVNGTIKSPSFIDDDQMATYYFTSVDTNYVYNIFTADAQNSSSNLQYGQIIQGKRGTSLNLNIQSTTEVQQSDYLFGLLGSEDTTTYSSAVDYIDTNITVRGVTTGSSITIPIRLIRKQ